MKAWRREALFLRLTGGDRLKWLQKMVTAELTTIGSGAGCLAAACTRQGKMAGVMVVRIFEDHLLLETDEAGLRAHFERLIIMEDCAIAEERRGVWETFEGSGQWFHHEPWGGGFRSSTPLGTMTTVDPGLPAMAEEEYEARRIGIGWPRWGRDMGPDELPMEAGLEPAAISYLKGCYLGQEVIQRVKTYSEPPKRLVQLRLERPMTALTAEGVEVGQVTSSTGLVALGYVNKPHNKPGTRLDGAEVAALPWHAFAQRPPDRPPSQLTRA